MVTRPCMHKSNVVAEAYANLRENRIWDFVQVFDNIRLEHATAGKTCILTGETEEEYVALIPLPSILLYIAANEILTVVST